MFRVSNFGFRISCLLAATGVVILSGCGGPTVAKTSPDRNAAAGVDRVSAGKPQRKTLTLSTLQPGRIDAFEETPLYSKVTGYVDEVLVDIGDRVDEDQRLVRLWVPEMEDDLEQHRALVAQAEADVEQAKAAVAAAQAAARTAEARVSQAQAGIARAEADCDRWESEYKRNEELATGGSVTARLVDEKRNAWRAAEAACQEAAANVKSAEAAAAEAGANVRKIQADQTSAEARLKVAGATLARTQTLLDYAEIKAPFAGVVTRRSVDTGHYVHPANGGGTKPLVVVASTDKVRVFVDVPEVEAPLVDAGDGGDAAVVRVQALGGREFDATVTRTSWSLDPANRALRVEIDVLNDEGLLRSGMYATVNILLEEREDVLALPIAAILREAGAAYCYAVESGKLVRRPLELGLRSGDEVEVLGGIEPDDTIVLARVESLHEGQSVEVLPSAPKRLTEGNLR
ncbi:MAG: efflux RND transporter periplasmic adaptor subunit [Planctomycetes bacterium]|nr:efflux RND transporter periplasmic adaptor subunit [Planctomycetota bacterium]